MKVMFRGLLVFLMVASPFGLGACGSAMNKSPLSAVSDLFPSRVPVVKARTKDLKELPLGHERALAFEKQRKFGFWALGGTADFVQPKLPEPGSEMDGSLLPPKEP